MKVYIVMVQETLYEHCPPFIEKIFLNETDAINFIKDAEYSKDMYIVEALAH